MALRDKDFPAKEFPNGLRVLAVDDDRTCLFILKVMLQKYDYKVTACSDPTEALSILRERKNEFDMVLTSLHMHAMSGYTLLEYIRDEMDLPAILVTSETKPSTLLGAAEHGGYDCFFKPVNIKELKYMWQTVFKMRAWKSWTFSSSEDSDSDEQISDDAEKTSLGNDDLGDTLTFQKGKRESNKDQDGGDRIEKFSSSKKQRHVWTDPVHEKFVEAVNVLGIDKAVPRKILELMPGLGLTKEIISSHLQKYRIKLRKEAQQKHKLDKSSRGSVGQNAEACSHGKSLYSDLALRGQAFPRAVPRVNPGLLSQPPVVHQPALVQSTMQSCNRYPLKQVNYCQPSTTSQSNVLQQVHHSIVAQQNSSSGLQTWSSSSGNLQVADNAQNADILFLQSGQQQAQYRHASTVQAVPRNNFQIGGSTVPMTQRSMVVPSQSLHCFQARNNQNSLSQQLYNCSNNLDHATTVQASCMEVQPTNNFQFSGSTVLTNQTSMVVPSQSLHGFQKRTIPNSVNQHVYNGSNNLNHPTTGQASCMVVQPTNNFQIGGSTVLTNQTSMVVPSQSLHCFQTRTIPNSVSQHVYNCSNNLDHATTIRASCRVVQPTNNFQISGSYVLTNQTSMAVPSQSLHCFLTRNKPNSFSQHVFNGSSNNLDHGVISSLSSNVPYDMGKISDGGIRNFDVGPGTSTGFSLGTQQQRRNFGFASNAGTGIPTGFVVDDNESPITNPDDPHAGSSVPECFSLSDFIYDLSN